MVYDVLVQETMAIRNQYVLDRSAPDEKTSDLHVSRITEHVSAELTRELDAISDKDVDMASHLPALSDRFGGFGTEMQFNKHLKSRLQTELNQPMIPLQYIVPRGSHVLGTPYDREWQTGGGIAWGARHDGKATTFGVNGFSAAGVGFYLSTSSDVPLMASVTPEGFYNYNWSSFEDMPFLRSSGGIGLTVYTNEEPNPSMSLKPTLWSLSGVTRFTGDKGQGRIADASSIYQGPFGPIRLAPILLNMTPGVRYLIWVWCWQTLQTRESSPFISFMSMEMPFVSVNLSTPPVGPH